jgi:hypothetical protein
MATIPYSTTHMQILCLMDMNSKQQKGFVPVQKSNDLVLCVEACTSS